MLAASEPRLLSGLLLLSYPLHPPGRPDRLRTEHFAKLQTPTLFISGAKDAFASIEELNSAIGLIPAWTRLLPVADPRQIVPQRVETDLDPGAIDFRWVHEKLKSEELRRKEGNLPTLNSSLS